MKIPKQRTKNIVVQKINKEVLVYDLETNKAFCLNETLTSVFQNCDGKNTLVELKAQTQFTDDLIFLALDKLRENNLIETDEKSFLGGISRREVIRKIGFASLVTLPVISTIIAPQAVHAVSRGICSFPSVPTCQSDADCAGMTCTPPSGCPPDSCFVYCDTVVNSRFKNCCRIGTDCTIP